LSAGFYFALWGQITLGILVLLSGWQEPRFLITLSAVLNATAMMIAFPLIYWLNRRELPKSIQASWWRKLVMLIAFTFFVIFVALNIIQNL